jgi:hypothetical protein
VRRVGHADVAGREHAVGQFQALLAHVGEDAGAELLAKALAQGAGVDAGQARQCLQFGAEGVVQGLHRHAHAQVLQRLPCSVAVADGKWRVAQADVKGRTFDIHGAATLQLIVKLAAQDQHQFQPRRIVCDAVRRRRKGQGARTQFQPWRGQR